MNSDLIFITAYCPTETQVDRLEQCIDSLSDIEGFDLAIISHSEIPLRIQKKAKYYIYDSDNDISWEHELRHFEYHTGKNHQLKTNLLKKTPFYGFAIYRMFSIISQLAIGLGYKRIYHVEYDYVIKDKSIFNNHRKFLDKFGAVFFTLSNDQDMLLGGFKSIRVDQLPEDFRIFNKSKMKKRMIEQDLKPLEIFTKQIFMESTQCLFINSDFVKDKIEPKKFPHQEQHWCLYYNIKSKKTGIFYLNMFEQQKITVELNGNLVSSYILKNYEFLTIDIGLDNEVQSIRILRDDVVIFDEVITDEFKNILKINSQLDVF